ncbi:MAG: glycoside hydrolase family 16 protein [Clostridia bacterium]|nr:glycoside hydrolase family 16 protein [Clostridia bacterium]
MRRTAVLVVTILVLVMTTLSFTSCDKKSEEEPKGPELIFCDEFDTLDTSVWNIYNGIRKGGYWDKNQVFAKDGNLVIRTSLIGGKYYTGAIDTNNNWEEHYGYYEAKVLVPKASGMWAAFWIFCDEMGGPSKDADIVGTELDIFESPYYKNDGEQAVTYQSAYHIGDYGANYLSGTSYIDQLLSQEDPVNIFDAWHVFGLDWTENGYDFYLDGKLMWSPNMEGNVSKKDSFLFLSCEIDGANGNASKSIFQIGTEPITANPEGAFPTSYTEEGSYISDFLVDYVKVWESNPYKK